jgi:hypothetical protein
VVMESLSLCKDAGEFEQRLGRTLDAAIHASYSQYPGSQNCLGMVNGSEFNWSLVIGELGSEPSTLC